MQASSIYADAKAPPDEVTCGSSMIVRNRLSTANWEHQKGSYNLGLDGTNGTVKTVHIISCSIDKDCSFFQDLGKSKSVKKIIMETPRLTNYQFLLFLELVRNCLVYVVCQGLVEKEYTAVLNAAQFSKTLKCMELNCISSKFTLSTVAQAIPHLPLEYLCLFVLPDKDYNSALALVSAVERNTTLGAFQGERKVAFNDSGITGFTVWPVQEGNIGEWFMFEEDEQATINVALTRNYSSVNPVVAPSDASDSDSES